MIAGKPYRIGIVGASSLAGKELADTLAESSFAAMDFVFFTGDPGTTRKYWKAARLAGASIVDLSYALEAEPGVVVCGPWAHLAAPSAHQPDLTTPAVVAAHPVALMALLLAHRIHTALPIRAISATVFEPASEHGRAAMDELHQQTVALLSFQALPREQYDAQVAFNMVPSLGDAAKVDLAATQARILAHYAELSEDAAPELALQLAQAPVFHGYLASVLLELQAPATAAQVEASLHGESVDLIAPASDPPSNISAAGQPDMLVSVRSATAGDGPSTRFWFWLAADNLKLAALNAIACANELRRLRPQGKVQ